MRGTAGAGAGPTPGMLRPSSVRRSRMGGGWAAAALSDHGSECWVAGSQLRSPQRGCDPLLVSVRLVALGVRLSLCLSVHLKCWLNETRPALSTANSKMLSQSTEKGSLEMNHKREKRCFEYQPFGILTTLSGFSKPVLNFHAVFRLTCSSSWCLGHYWAPGKRTV